MLPGLDMYSTDPALPSTTAGEEPDDLDHYLFCPTCEIVYIIYVVPGNIYECTAVHIQVPYAARTLSCSSHCCRFGYYLYYNQGTCTIFKIHIL